jgi:hypothetical protein
MAKNGILMNPMSLISIDNNRKIFKDILAEYQSFIIVPEWLHTWINTGEQPISVNQFPNCYSGYYRIGISPYCSPINEKFLSKYSIPSLNNKGEELSITDEAWISTCLYHRYDKKFGCIYPKDLAQWCKIDRIKILNSIKPDQQGVCDQTICSRSEFNQKIFSFLKYTDQLKRIKKSVNE